MYRRFTATHRSDTIVGVNIIFSLRVLNVGQFSATIHDQDIAHTNVTVNPSTSVESMKPFVALSEIVRRVEK